MEISDYKKLIGCECLVIDPMKRPHKFEGGVIVGVEIRIKTIVGDVVVTPVYSVKLDKLTKSRAKWKHNPYYNRVVKVNTNNIKLNLKWKDVE